MNDFIWTWTCIFLPCSAPCAVSRQVHRLPIPGTGSSEAEQPALHPSLWKAEFLPPSHSLPVRPNYSQEPGKTSGRESHLKWITDVLRVVWYYPDKPSRWDIWNSPQNTVVRFDLSVLPKLAYSHTTFIVFAIFVHPCVAYLGVFFKLII